MKKHVFAVAAGLHYLGIKQGSTLCSFLPVGAEQVSLGLASAIQGYNLVAVNSQITDCELPNLLTKINAEALFTTPQDLEVVYQKLTGLSTPMKGSEIGELLHLKSVSQLKYVIHTGHAVARNTLRFRDCLVYFNEEGLQTEISPNSTVLSVVDASGNVKQSYTQELLLTQSGSVAGTLGIDTDQVTDFNEELSSGNPNAVLGTLACLQKLGKLVINNK